MNSQFTKIVRILLGLILIAFGANKLYPVIPLPQPPEDAASFMGSLAATGYVLPVIAVFEIVIGLLLLFKKWVALALIMLVPLSLNILLFHLFLDVPSIGLALLVVIMNGILLYKHKQKYRPLLAA